MPEFPFLQHPLRTHQEVLERAREIGRHRGLTRVAIAVAGDDDVLAAIYSCKQDGIADAVLIGDPDRIQVALQVADVPEHTFEIISTRSDEESAIRAAELAGSGRAGIVMKGFLKTSTLLKILLKHEYGLRENELVSHSAVLSVSSYGKLLNVTDGGTLVRPTPQQQITVIANGYQVMRAVGIQKPVVAVLGPSKRVREEMPETLTASRLVELVREQWSNYLEICGPVTMEDLDSPGDSDKRADILLTHTIEEGNIIVKTFIQFGGAVFMGLIAGARVPISLVSRSDNMLNKRSSIALAVLIADYQRRNFRALPPISEEAMELLS